MDNIVKFYSSLGLGFKIIKMGAKDLNKSTSKKYDLEAWFPRSKTYRELVSCSNCTDYQAIKVNCRISDGKDKKYVHMLNCTLCAIQRTLCCLVETHYNEKRNAIVIPQILRKYMGYEEVIDLSTK
jgi:seryl-tRNA synthetase